MTPMKLDCITSNPNHMNGQPCIRNPRLTVCRVIGSGQLRMAGAD